MQKVRGIAVLCLALSMVLSTVSYAADVKSTAVIVEDDMLPLENYLDAEQVVTVSEIDQLCDERLEAIVTHNMEKYNEITDTLRSYGVEEISYNDVMCMAGDEGTIDNANGVPLSTETRGGITFETFDTTYKLNGKYYDVRRILATPDPSYPHDTWLYTTGDTDELRNDRSAMATVMKLMGIGVQTSVGLASNTIGTAQTVYRVLGDVNDALSSTDTVTNISASYTWNVAEACSFVLVCNSGTLESYQIRGIYHKAAASLGVSVPTLVVGNGQNIVTGIDQGSMSGTATPINYKSKKKAVEGFISGKRYQSSVTRVIFKGIEDQIIEQRNLKNPTAPTDVGY